VPAFEAQLDSIRKDLKIPALSAAIAVDTEIIWSKGFGLADVDGGIRATDTTSYLLASLTKPFASTVILQLVEAGKIRLDDPISAYGVSLDPARERGMVLASDDSITVRHLFSHTAQGTPGCEYVYNGYLFSFLDAIVETTSGRTFGELAVERIIKPLNLTHTAPNICDSVNFSLAGVDSAAYSANLARPYAFDSLGNVVESSYEAYFGGAAGLMSSAVDVARYSIALDQNLLLKPETRELAFSPTISNDGDSLPYGLGWFSGSFDGTRIVWHYGLWNTNSSLIVKVPDRKLTLVVLANSNALTLCTALGMSGGGLLSSQVVTDFLQTFAFPEYEFPRISYSRPEGKLAEQMARFKSSEHRSSVITQLLSFARFYYYSGRPDETAKLMRVYNAVFTKPLPPDLSRQQPLARIDSVDNNADRTVSFTLKDETRLRVYAVGEGIQRMFDYGWIEKAVSGDIVWEMRLEKTEDAGGDPKNRLADVSIRLPAGDYHLRYQSDDSHSFMLWNAEPPEIAFYGIAVYRAD